MKETEKSYPLILAWMRQQEIEDKMLWKKAAIEQEMFVRDALCDFYLHVPCFVVSTHHSKSIELPVYRFRMHNGIIVTMRENFYGWVVSVKSPFVLNLPKDLVYGDGENKEDISPCYAEGFKEDWVYPYCVENIRLSTFRVDGNYMLWALMRELNMLKNPAQKEPRKLGEKVAEAIIRYHMGFVDKESRMHLHDVFPFTYYYVYGYDFSKAHGLDTFVSIKDKDISEEEEEKIKIADFAKRVAMEDESEKRLQLEMECLQVGLIDTHGLEFKTEEE